VILRFFDKVFFTNHPSRPKTGTHSYFQRIVPYYEGDINIKINSLYGPIQIKRIIPDGGLAQLPIENLEVTNTSPTAA